MLDGINSRLDMAKETIRQLENTELEIIQIRHREKKGWKKINKYQSPAGQCQGALHTCNQNLRKGGGWGDRKKIFEEKNG